MQAKRSGCSDGFTLVELMVVIGVLILLVGLMLPSATNALRRGRATKCAANLHIVYNAYQQAKADEEKNIRLSPLKAEAWAGILSSYLDQDTRPFVCPEDEEPHFGGISARLAMTQGELAGAPELVPGVSGPNCEQDPMYGHQPSVAVASSPEGDAWQKFTDERGALTPTIRLEGQMPWTLYDASNRFYSAFVAYKSATDFEGVNRTWELVVSAVNKGDNPNWNKRTSCTLQIVNPVNGRCTVRMSAATYKLSLTNSLDTVVSLRDGAYKVISKNEYQDRMFVGSSYGVGAVNRCSYGMTDFDAGIKLQDKIVAMDYDSNMIHARFMAPQVSWKTKFNCTRYDELKFARHKGRVNVLFGTGAVKSMKPEEIDPWKKENLPTPQNWQDNDAILSRYWIPDTFANSVNWSE